MTTFKLEIDLDNAAFEEDGELANCLRKVSDKATEHYQAGPVIDTNGNTVGSFWTYEPVATYVDDDAEYPTFDLNEDGCVPSEHGILTVGQLKAILADVDDDRHVVLDDRGGWYTNIEATAIPSDDVWTCVTFFQGTEFDSRQF